MRKSAFAGLFACAVIIAMPSPEVSASSLEPLDINKLTATSLELAFLGADDIPVQLADASTNDSKNNEKTDDSQKPEIYTVKKGDSLSKIAKEYETSWKRLFYKNKSIKHPDVINVNDKLTIPEEDEKLKERKIPANQQPEPAVQTSRQTRRTTTANRTAPTTNNWKRPARSYAQISRGSSSGNLYTRGYCTWYVKNRRPDLPNNLGNAITWAARARAQGIPTGRTPRVGAVGQQGNHVVYVEQVHRNGTVTISEMNYKGWGITNRRTVPASNFAYIY